MAARQAKATGKAYAVHDADGLSLAINPKGRRFWHFRFVWAEKQKRISFGPYPEITPREARTLRDEARALLAKGVDPRTDRQRKRQALRLATMPIYHVSCNDLLEVVRQIEQRKAYTTARCRLLIITSTLAGGRRV